MYLVVNLCGGGQAVPAPTPAGDVTKFVFRN